MCNRITFFRADIERTCYAAHRVISARREEGEFAWRRVKHVASVSSLIEGLPKENAPPGGAFFHHEGADAWTAFVSGQRDGWYTMANALNIAAPEIETVIVNDASDDTEFPKRGFEVLRNGKSCRRVMVWKEEDGWHFVNRGEPLEIEDLSCYSRRAIKDRITSAQLHSLLLLLGIDLSAVLTKPISDARILTT